MSNELLARPLVFGARGQLGTDLTAVLADREPVTPSRDEADLEKLDSLKALIERVRPTIVLNAAAYTNVDACEKDPGRAFAVNATAVDALARECENRGIAFGTVSTDYVFSGDGDRPYREEDDARPVNSYGVSKLAGELLTRRHGSRWFVFRTCGLYGTAGASNKGYTFVERVFGQAERGEAVRVVDDVFCTPSFTLHVAQAIRRIIENGRFGLYHVTNAGACNWYEFAREAFTITGASAQVQAVKQSDFKTFAPRPRYTVLAHGALESAKIQDLPDWRVGLRDYLDARKRA
jgi:dTDP-4-dehydrorhamnose reductase